MNISCLSVLVMVYFFFFCKREKKICLTQDKKPHHEDKERVTNLQQGHIIMQWPSQAHLHRWVEFVSLDHKSTQDCLEPVTDIIQQDGWISGSQETFTNLPDGKKCSPSRNTGAPPVLPLTIKQSWLTNHTQMNTADWKVHVEATTHMSFTTFPSFTSLHLCFNSSVSNHDLEKMIEIDVLTQIMACQYKCYMTFNINYIPSDV